MKIWVDVSRLNKGLPCIVVDDGQAWEYYESIALGEGITMQSNREPNENGVRVWIEKV